MPHTNPACYQKTLLDALRFLFSKTGTRRLLKGPHALSSVAFQQDGTNPLSSSAQAVNLLRTSLPLDESLNTDLHRFNAPLGRLNVFETDNNGNSYDPYKPYLNDMRYQVMMRSPTLKIMCGTAPDPKVPVEVKQGYISDFPFFVKAFEDKHGVNWYNVRNASIDLPESPIVVGLFATWVVRGLIDPEDISHFRVRYFIDLWFAAREWRIPQLMYQIMAVVYDALMLRTPNSWDLTVSGYLAATATPERQRHALRYLFVHNAVDHILAGQQPLDLFNFMQRTRFGADFGNWSAIFMAQYRDTGASEPETLPSMVQDLFEDPRPPKVGSATVHKPVWATNEDVPTDQAIQAYMTALGITVVGLL